MDGSRAVDNGSSTGGRYPDPVSTEDPSVTEQSVEASRITRRPTQEDHSTRCASAVLAPRPICAGAFAVPAQPTFFGRCTRITTTRRQVWPRLTRPPAVADIAEQFKASTATVVTEYRGLTVANLAELRRSLAGNATYTVAKNTLVKRAAAEAGIEGLDELFAGPTAIAFVTGETVDVAKAIRKFAKENKALVVKGGYMDGHALTVAEVERIADLESREVLLASWPAP